MESVLHDIEELQSLADDLATLSGVFDKERYENDCDLFLRRISYFVEEQNLANADYIGTKLMEIHANLRYLLRGDRLMTDLTRYQALVNNGLNAVYRNMRNPTLVEAEGEDYGG